MADNDDQTVKVLLYTFAFIGIAIAVFVIAGSILVVGGVLVVVAVVADLICRPIYAQKLTAYERANGSDLAKTAKIEEFVGECTYESPQFEQLPLLLWKSVIPENMTLEIYRTQQRPQNYEQAKADGYLILSTKQEMCWPVSNDANSFDVVYDRTAEEGVFYFTPYIVGRETTIKVLPYSFLSTSLNITKRIVNRVVAGVSSECIYYLDRYNEEQDEIEDLRPQAMKKKDEILAALKMERENNEALDQAIAEIQADSELSEREKTIAIETLETSIEQ